MFLKVIGDRFVPDASFVTEVQLGRQKYLVQKLIQFIPDEIPEVVHGLDVQTPTSTVNPLHASAAAGAGAGAGAAATDAPEVFIAPSEEQAARKAAYNDLLSLQRAGAVPPVVKTKKQRASETGVRSKNKAQRGSLKPNPPPEDQA